MRSTARNTIVRVYDGQGEEDEQVVGAGVLISPNRILTCTHVVHAALGKRLDFADRDGFCPQKGDGPISVDLLSRKEKLQAFVDTAIPTGEFAVTKRGKDEDIAVLELRDPVVHCDCAAFVSLADNDLLNGESYEVLGFPFGHSDGLTAKGPISSYNEQWIQLDPTEAGPVLQQGYSGAPVWNERLSRFVGIAVAADLTPESQSAFMIPPEALRMVCSDLALSQGTPREVDDDIDLQLIAHLCDRADQKATLEPALKAYVSARPRHPFVCVLHGRDDEAVEMYVERLHFEELPMWLGEPVPQLIELNWPSSLLRSRDQGDLEKYLRDQARQIGLDDPTDATPMVIRARLTSDDFLGGNAAVISAFVDFWRSYSLAQVRLVVVCLAMRYTMDTGTFAADVLPPLEVCERSIREMINALTFDPQHGDVPHLFGPVRRDEAELWVSHRRVKQIRGLRVDAIKRLYADLKEQWRDGTRLPMQVLAPRLEELLRGGTT